MFVPLINLSNSSVISSVVCEGLPSDCHSHLLKYLPHIVGPAIAAVQILYVIWKCSSGGQFDHIQVAVGVDQSVVKVKCKKNLFLLFHGETFPQK